VNKDRRKQLREAYRLMGEARRIVEIEQGEERDNDDRIEEADLAIEDANKIGQKGYR
jgi:hypothetical protein